MSTIEIKNIPLSGFSPYDFVLGVQNGTAKLFPAVYFPSINQIKTAINLNQKKLLLGSLVSPATRSGNASGWVGCSTTIDSDFVYWDDTEKTFKFSEQGNYEIVISGETMPCNSLSEATQWPIGRTDIEVGVTMDGGMASDSYIIPWNDYNPGSARRSRTYQVDVSHIINKRGSAGYTEVFYVYAGLNATLQPEISVRINPNSPNDYFINHVAIAIKKL